jgi:hypothetical protein
MVSEFDRDDVSYIAIRQEIFNDSSNWKGAENWFGIDS